MLKGLLLLLIAILALVAVAKLVYLLVLLAVMLVSFVVEKLVIPILWLVYYLLIRPVIWVVGEVLSLPLRFVAMVLHPPVSMASLATSGVGAHVLNGSATRAVGLSLGSVCQTPGCRCANPTPARFCRRCGASLATH